MLQNVTATPSRRSLEFGIYRDGDNNLDAIQEATLSQALRTSARDGRIEFTVEDTTRTHAAQPARDESGGGLRTYRYTIADGDVIGARAGKAHDMSDEANLARFVARTLDNARNERCKTNVDRSRRSWRRRRRRLGDSRRLVHVDARYRQSDCRRRCASCAGTSRRRGARRRRRRRQPMSRWTRWVSPMRYRAPAFGILLRVPRRCSRPAFPVTLRMRSPHTKTIPWRWQRPSSVM